MKTAFINANVIDVENRQVLKNHTILVEDGIITALGADVNTDGAKIIDVAGKTVTPGLFNCHVHITNEPVANQALAQKSTVGKTIAAINHLKQYIESGVTFIRDLGSPDGIDIDLRDAVKSGDIVMAPDMIVSGRCICMTGGHGWNSIGIEADGVDGVKTAARLQLRNGADLIKIMATGGVTTRGVEPGSPQFDIDELKAAVHEAHKVGAIVSTHAQGRIGIRNALLAGIDCIEHACYLEDDTIQMMKDQNSWMVPTLCAPYFINEHLKGAGIPDFIIRKNTAVIEAHSASFRRAFAEGINLALGTDASTPFNSHGATAMELVLMTRQGLTPMDALVIGTINSAKLCGVADSLGSVTVGKKAHLAVFDGDPMEDINAMFNCVMTVKNGEVLYSK